MKLVPVILFPLLVVFVLAVFGITFSFWLYAMLAAGCLAAASIAWLASRKAERKIDRAVKGN